MYIKEVLKELQKSFPELTRSKLQYYDRINIVQAGREKNNYRNYSDKEIASLSKAILLSKLGYSLNYIRKLITKDPVAIGQFRKDIIATLNIASTLKEIV